MLQLTAFSHPVHILLVVVVTCVLAAAGCSSIPELDVGATTSPATAGELPRLRIGHDQDGDGIDDLQDIVMGARAEVARRPRYRSAYYAGGYPPEDEGVCTDLVWRALRTAGYELKELLDRDIAEHPEDYPGVENPDPNIDFRRVRNLIPFFEKYAVELTTKVEPGNSENLQKWQGGDIVVYGRPHPHIGIVSERRRSDGVPLLIHNGGPYPSEEDRLLKWPSRIAHHFRFPGAHAQGGS